MTDGDAALMEALSRRELAALEAFYERHHAVALGLALRVLGEQGRAEEVVQDAFMALWRTAHLYSPAKGTPKTWLLSIVRNGAIDRLRRGQRQAGQVRIAVVEHTLVDRSVPEAWERLAAEERAMAIRSALAALPAKQRETIELAYFGGLSVPEIAAQSGEALGTVKGRMRLGLQKLRYALTSLGSG
ncbi:MAG: sigma-70 family RNA polymerase sigma factor [Chloroflexi bacterium]|nr:sigma-70 family RNA polymerase sigma factor [Chloroflexota bacterium]